eukprot:15419346-Alexandrium_andersonii.AAC.1
MRQCERLRGVKTAISVPVEEGEDARKEPRALLREVQVRVRVRALLRPPTRREGGEHQIGGAEGGASSAGGTCLRSFSTWVNCATMRRSCRRERLRGGALAGS